MDFCTVIACDAVHSTGLLHLHQVMNEVHCSVTSHAVYVCHSRRRDLIGKVMKHVSILCVHSKG